MTDFDKIVIALCEGPHDTAFLYRVLRSDCYKNFSKKIEELPYVVKKFIKKGYEKVNELEILKIDALRNFNIPNKILYKDDKLILLYAMGGDSESMENSKRLMLINEYRATLVSTDDKEFNPFEENGFSDKQIEYSFLFFYDADEDASKQVLKTNKYLEALGIDKSIKHKSYIQSENTNYGCFIFSEDGHTGTLENIMFNVIKTKKNEILLEKAGEYFSCNCDIRYKKKRSIEYLNDESCKEISKRKKQPKIYEKKSILGIMGQLQNSGVSNVVTIEHSDYIQLETGSIPDNIQEIIDFFSV